MTKPSSETIYVFLVLLIAALLRFWKIWDLEFSYDELSAIFRAENRSWHQHIQNGVLPDGHPALVQTLLWLVGDHVTLLKSIAAAFGIASVYFIYRTGKSAFNPAAGLVAAALMSVLYMPVFWSQQIRPYTFGMCFSTALLWTFSEIVFENKTQHLRYFRFAILAALCAYTHYFAGLMAAMLILAGFACQLKSKPKQWLFTAFITFILFLPHLPITLSQFQQGGLAWLGAPKWHFIQQHLYEVFSRSDLFIIIIFLFVVTGIISIFRNHILVPWNKIILFLYVFLFPIIIGFIYSKLRVPVLQNSVLVFSLPALFLLIGYLMGNTQLFIFRLQLFVILFCGIMVLILGRKHYTIGSMEPWSSAARELLSGNCEGNNYVDAPNDIWNYKWKKEQRNNKIKHSYNLISGNTSIKEKIAAIPTNAPFKIVLGSGSNPGIFAALEDQFTVSQRKSFIGAEVICFAPNKPENTHYSVAAIFRETPLRYPISELIPHWNFQNIVIRFKPFDSSASGEIQTGITNGEYLVDWRSSSCNYKTDAIHGWNYHIIKLADIEGWNRESIISVKVLHGETPVPGMVEIRSSQGNPYIYGIP